MAIANCNWWQYSRWTYQIGRSVKAKAFTAEERAAIITFIEGFVATRKALVARLNLKKGDNAEISKQNDYALGKMVQLIGRQIKVLPPTEEEKTLCDTMFEAVADNVRIPGWEIVESEDTPSEEVIDEENEGTEQTDETNPDGVNEAGDETNPDGVNEAGDETNPDGEEQSEPEQTQEPEENQEPEQSEGEETTEG